jgi:transcriptional regulator with XRE-family HTH domain
MKNDRLTTLYLIGVNVKKLRLSQGFSQDRLAESANITPQFLCLIENGTRCASLGTYCHLAEALNIEIGILFNPISSLETQMLELSSIVYGCDRLEMDALIVLLRGAKAALGILRLKESDECGK